LARNYSDRKRILEKGSAGFLNSRLIDRLLERGDGYCGNVNPVGPRSCYDQGERCDPPKDVPLQRQFNFSVAREPLGWQSKVKLRWGLARTINFLAELKAASPGPA
jgi:hypothetical protein